MLNFMRNKLVRIERTAPDELLVHGLLDDDIYSLEMDIRVKLPDLRIISIDGRWKRWTTPECPRAIEPLKNAIGLSISQKDLYETIRREIGKKSCRHFANLLIECCDALRGAHDLISREEEKIYQQKEEVDIGSIFPGCTKGKGQVIDLHVHTYPASSCASSSIEDQIKAAKKAGLDGICITDHNYIWDRREIESLRDRFDFLILAGTEITTDQGDILVFGLEKVFGDIVPLDDLSKEVRKGDGFMIAAHPFRGFLIFGINELGLTPEKAAERKVFKLVDGIEVLNGRVNSNENLFTHKVAEICGLPETGGSDAHETKEVGIYATYFEDEIKNEEDLIMALRSGRYSPCLMRHRSMEDPRE